MDNASWEKKPVLYLWWSIKVFACCWCWYFCLVMSVGILYPAYMLTLNSSLLLKYIIICMAQCTQQVFRFFEQMSFLLWGSGGKKRCCCCRTKSSLWSLRREIVGCDDFKREKKRREKRGVCYTRITYGRVEKRRKNRMISMVGVCLLCQVFVLYYG